MILYHGEPNLYSLKPLIALEEKGASYERRPIGAMPLERAVPDYPATMEQRINLEREGPVLIDGETRIVSSFFLLEYIAEAVDGPALIPDGALGRYNLRAIGQTVAGLIAPFVSQLGLARYPLPAGGDFGDVEPEERRAAWLQASSPGAAGTGDADRLRPTLARLDALLARGGGDWFERRYSIADIDVFAMIRNLPDLAPGLLDETPALAGLVARMEARPAVQRALALGWGGEAARAFLPGPEVS
ncbi:MAG: glutathione S-transferase, partial [Sphingomonas bacterium]|nr:glutathione S-transferase [Sphingomonas bacterium]